MPDGVTPAARVPVVSRPAARRTSSPTEPWFTFWEHVEGRPTIGHAPWEDYEPESSLRAQWYRFDDPPRADDGAWDPLALVALCDTMPGAVGERLGPAGRERQWLPPSADFTVHVLGRGPLRLDPRRSTGPAMQATGYASADMEMWDVERGPPRLVAYATQTMVFSFPK